MCLVPGVSSPAAPTTFFVDAHRPSDLQCMHDLVRCVHVAFRSDAHKSWLIGNRGSLDGVVSCPDCCRIVGLRHTRCSSSSAEHTRAHDAHMIPPTHILLASVCAQAAAAGQEEEKGTRSLPFSSGHVRRGSLFLVRPNPKTMARGVRRDDDTWNWPAYRARTPTQYEVLQLIR